MTCFTQGLSIVDEVSTACGPLGACNGVVIADCTTQAGYPMTDYTYNCTIKNDCALLTVPASSSYSTTPCSTSDSDWRHFVNENNEVILSLKENGNELGVVTTAVFVRPQPVLYLGQGYLSRHYLVDTLSLIHI